MCILSYLPPGVEPDLDALLTGGVNNPHGHGWAIATPGRRKIVVGKSLDLAEALDRFVAARAQAPHGHALFHSRYATHGSVTLDNCHPFRVSRSRRIVLAHNGVLPTDAWPVAGDDRSDTRILAGRSVDETVGRPRRRTHPRQARRVGGQR